MIGFPLKCLVPFAVLYSINYDSISAFPIKNINKSSGSQNIVYIEYTLYPLCFYDYIYPDVDVDEWVEIFPETIKSPKYILTDEQVENIIKCDFDPNGRECKFVILF